MSVKQYLRDSDLFDENPPQKNPTYRGTVTFPLRGAERGATIYATDERKFGILVSALDRGSFPNNAGLYAFVRANYCEMAKNNVDAFMLDDSLIGKVIEIIRGGLE